MRTLERQGCLLFTLVISTWAHLQTHCFLGINDLGIYVLWPMWLQHWYKDTGRSQGPDCTKTLMSVTSLSWGLNPCLCQRTQELHSSSVMAFLVMTYVLSIVVSSPAYVFRMDSRSSQMSLGWPSTPLCCMLQFCSELEQWAMPDLQLYFWPYILLLLTVLSW